VPYSKNQMIRNL